MSVRRGFKRTIGLLVPTVALLAAVSGAAHADPNEPGFYVRGAVGLFFLGDMDARPTAIALHGDFELDPREAYAGALGYRVHRSFRVEGEVAYRSNPATAVDVTGLGRLTYGGRLESWTFMANGYVDFSCGQLRPYLGVGLGAVSTHDDRFTTNGIRSNLDGTAFAYQFMIGFGYDLWESLTLDLDYRYLQYGDIELNNTVSGRQDIEFDPSHAFMLGLRYRF